MSHMRQRNPQFKQKVEPLRERNRARQRTEERQAIEQQHESVKLVVLKCNTNLIHLRRYQNSEKLNFATTTMRLFEFTMISN